MGFYVRIYYHSHSHRKMQMHVASALQILCTSTLKISYYEMKKIIETITMSIIFALVNDNLPNFNSTRISAAVESAAFDKRKMY